jgi:hypothetical protein
MSEELVDWKSDPNGMMKVYQGQNYDLGQSIADLVDNGIDEGAKEIDIVINPGNSEDELFIAIFDNGTGIAENQFDDIMKLGHSTKTDAGKLGVFGVGLKLSSLAQANEVTIVSRQDENTPSLRRISAPYILKNNQNKLMKYPVSDADGDDSSAYKFCYQKMLEEEWSTFVLLESIHAVDQFVAINENYKTSLSKELKRVMIHLGLTFHRILEKEEVKIKIGNGSSSKNIQPLHPGMPMEDDIDFGTVSSNQQTVAYDNNNVQLNVKIEYIILPHTKTIQHKSSLEINKGYKRANDMQGLYIYRNDRLIQYGNWQGMFGNGVNRNDEHAKLGKIFIDIPSDHIKLFGLNPTKTEVKLPKEFLRRLLDDSKKERKWGPIENGKEISFFVAFDKRYRKDGNAHKKRKEKIEITTSSGTGDETSGVELIADPKARIRERKKKLKPRKIITSVEQNDQEIVLTFTGSDEERNNFIESIKEWRLNE